MNLRRFPLSLLAGCLAFVPAICRAGAEVWVVLAQQKEQGGTIRTQGGGKSYVVESVIVVVMLGLALFVVCRSSRRG
jgi:hypothetical protein